MYLWKTQACTCQLSWRLEEAGVSTVKTLGNDQKNQKPVLYYTVHLALAQWY